MKEYSVGNPQEIRLRHQSSHQLYIHWEINVSLETICGPTEYSFSCKYSMIDVHV